MDIVDLASVAPIGELETMGLDFTVLTEEDALRRFSNLPGTRPPAYEHILRFHEELRLYDGNLEVAEFTALEADGQTHATIVNGDLSVTGCVAIEANRSQHTLLVVGDVRCARLYVRGRGIIRIDGSLMVTEAVFTVPGDEEDGGGIWVGGDIEAAAIVSLADSDIASSGAIRGWSVRPPGTYQGITRISNCSNDELRAAVLEPWIDGPRPDRWGVAMSLVASEDPFTAQPLPTRLPPPDPTPSAEAERHPALVELETFVASFEGTQRELLSSLFDRRGELQRLSFETRQDAVRIVRSKVNSPKLTVMRDQLLDAILSG